MVDISNNVNSTECMCSDLQTEDYSPLYAWYNYVLIILALPPLSVFGVCTNIVNVFVYSRKRMQNSANTYLLFLACSDFLVILTGLFIFWIDSARSYIPELARAPYTTVYTLPFGYMAQTCSIYFTVAAAFDCYINVCWKSLAKDYCSLKRSKQICFTVVLLSIMYNSLRFPQFNLRKCFHEASQEQIIEICPTSLFFTINMVYNVYMYMVLMTLLPFLFLLCLNAIIVCRQSLETNTSPNSATSSDTLLKIKEKGGGGDDTITMIMVVILFLACNTLVSFFQHQNYQTFNKIIFVLRINFRRISRSIRDKYCCSSRRSRQNLIYQPVTTRIIRQKIRKPSIRRENITEARTGNFNHVINELKVCIRSGSPSPVWQPLTHRHLPNIHWPSGCYDPISSHMMLMDDDGDSAWDDAGRVQVTPHRNTTAWMAEVNIVNGQADGYRQHIGVKTMEHISGKQTISITSL
uniref:G_PROTEIN_RECEP_F1_2 domain-containing protein n=1 Tax=Heterorhabditis bacteriophora TaxID=37862 RepID=A0A1I7XNB0_HETBA